MIYLIGGSPRIGKSIISNHLMAELSVSWISTDVLRTLVHDLTPEAERFIKFPYKGFSSNDDLSTLSIAKMVQYQITEAKSLEICIDSFVHHQIGVRDNQIIEGVHLLPEHVHKLMDTPEYKREIKVVFVICTDEKIQLTSMRKNSSHFDWLTGASDRTYEAVAAFVVAYSKWIQEECDKYQLPYIMREGRFDEENTKILKIVMP